MESADLTISLSRAVLLFSLSIILGEVLTRIKLPSILGQLFAGIILGLSGLHLLVPPEAVETLNSGYVELIHFLSGASSEQIFTAYREGFPIVESLSGLGLICLLFLTGVESDLNESTRDRRGYDSSG